MTFDASFNRSGYWWPDYAWTDDVRTMDLTTTQTRGAFLELRREPVRWGYNGTWSWFKTIGDDEPRDQVRRARLQQHQLRRDLRLSEPADLPLSQPAGRDRSTSCIPTRCRSSSTRTTPTPASGINSWFANDSVNITPQADAQRRSCASITTRRGCPSRAIPAPARTPRRESYPENARLPDLQRVVAAPVGGLRPHRLRTRRAQGQLRALRRFGIRREQRRGPGGQRGESGGDAGLDVHALGRTHSVHADCRRSHVGDRLQPRHAARSVAQGRVSRRVHRRRRSRLVARHVDPHQRRAQARLSRQQGAQSRAAVRSLHRRRQRHRSRAATTSIGTADDRVVQVCSVPRTLSGFGQMQGADRQRAPMAKATIRYTAFEATFSKSYSNGWSLLASYRVDQRDAKNIDPRNPNEARLRHRTTGVWALPETLPGRATERHLRTAVADAGGVDVHRRSRASTSIASCRCATRSTRSST